MWESDLAYISTLQASVRPRNATVIAKDPDSISVDTLNVLDSFGQTRALEHVVVCYLPGANSKVEAQDSGWSPSGVEHVHLTETAKMSELPAVCTTEAHASWTAWENRRSLIRPEQSGRTTSRRSSICQSRSGRTTSTRRDVLEKCPCDL